MNRYPGSRPRTHIAPQQRKLLGKTLDGFEVIDRPFSHLHLDLNLVREAIGKIRAPREAFAKLRVDMGRIVGQSLCVQTGDDDNIVYAQRLSRRGLTRFVLNREPEDCSTVIVILKRSDSRTFVLITAFIGGDAQPEPWDEKAGREAVDFWRVHALVWNGKDIVPGTDTTVCPW